MRIVHLSDIHLSRENLDDLQNYYIDALIKDLKSYQPIDLIVISGDMVDKAGDSLINDGHTDPYQVFEEEFIDKIASDLPFDKRNVLFIAGNHDIERKKINRILEAGLLQYSKSTETLTKICREFSKNHTFLNLDRMERYLAFEKRYHAESIASGKYTYSEFESTFVYEYGDIKIGIGLINDSWRCGEGLVKDHFFDLDQIDRCLLEFKKAKTHFNFLVCHHDLEHLHKSERSKFEDLLYNTDIHFILMGHEHSTRINKSERVTGKEIVYFRGRSTFDKPEERESEYQPGYGIIDINIDSKNISGTFRKFMKKRREFDSDLEDGHGIVIYTFSGDEHTNKLNKINKSDLKFE
ncbi:Calcineurin-like phosphoesterase [Chryseobacterium oleae]|uniref:Calcineurin-like phosphoesterase n=1 Tax=Chryseobacterium oleae TaxID=491207 RepID=A0A1I5CY94_CHROL|nr:metallophosphoesterase [Chryseobacterium oleae]SFN91970.1 Calcineurin-like phosphoesterase [Chryseobacterium oleae]